MLGELLCEMHPIKTESKPLSSTTVISAIRYHCLNLVLVWNYELLHFQSVVLLHLVILWQLLCKIHNVKTESNPLSNTTLICGIMSLWCISTTNKYFEFWVLSLYKAWSQYYCMHGTISLCGTISCELLLHLPECCVVTPVDTSTVSVWNLSWASCQNNVKPHHSLPHFSFS